jgi:hypothetical protein
VAVHDLQLVHDLQHLRGQALLDQLAHVGGDGFVQAVLVHERVVHAGRGGPGEAGAAAVRGLQVENRVVRSANALYRADVTTEGAHQDSLYERVLEAQRRSNNFTGSYLRSGTVSASAVSQRGSEQARVRLVQRVLTDEL